MDRIRFTLVGEGTSDENLIPILAWAVREQGVDVAQGSFPRWDVLAKRPGTMAEKITAGLQLYECDLLFVHRDADRTDPKQRRDEIDCAVTDAKSLKSFEVPSVPVIPVRETEAWLLIEERAIRLAANNPNGRNDLKLPSIEELEKCADPKAELKRVLRAATGLSPQRLKRFSAEAAKARIVDHISDFRLLRNLPAFRSLESDLAALRSRGWK